MNLLAEWTHRLHLPRLGDDGLQTGDPDHVVAHSRGSSMLTRPSVLTDGEIRTCLEERLRPVQSCPGLLWQIAGTCVLDAYQYPRGFERA